MDFPATVCGIPARIRIDRYYPGDSGIAPRHDRRTGDLVDPGEPPCDEEIGYTVLDSRGREAPWLQEKIEFADDEEICAEIRAHLAEQRRREEEARAEQRYEEMYG